MALPLLRIVTIVYVSLNVLITLIVSIIGAKYVRNEFKKNSHGGRQYQAADVTVQNTEISGRTDNQTNETDDKQEDNVEAVTTKLSNMHFVKLWLKLSWKMRGVYMSLVVHLFDVLTDLLIIIEWFQTDPEKIDNVDTQIMAWCAVAVLVFHNFISTIAFWMKEKNIYRCLLQFFYLLIFQEIFISHKKIVDQLKKQPEDDENVESEAVETTSSFKYIRSLEAVFESIPQSVLQLVYIMRTGDQVNIDLFVISLLSISQSVISMTLSIIKNDHLYMDTPRFKKHKKMLPPSFAFIKHALCRLSEVFYRIALLSLFWTVVGGEAFSVLLGVELFFIGALTLLECIWKAVDINADEVFLRVSAVVILPSEMTFALRSGGSDEPFSPTLSAMFNQFGEGEFAAGIAWCCWGLCWTCCCCYWPAVECARLCGFHKNHFYHPDIRIGVSMTEWIIVIIFAVINDDDNYLFSIRHGLALFAVGIIMFIIDTQYLSLLPDFRLPKNVSIRSMCGYALNGEFDELKRLNNNKIYLNGMKVTVPAIYEEDKISKAKLKLLHCINNAIQLELKLTETNIKAREFKIYSRFSADYSWWTQLKVCKTDIILPLIDTINLEKAVQNEFTERAYKTIRLEINPWDAYPYCALYALSNGHKHIVDWLEQEQGAKSHLAIDILGRYDEYHDDKQIAEEKRKRTRAREFLGIGYWNENETFEDVIEGN